MHLTTVLYNPIFLNEDFKSQHTIAFLSLYFSIVLWHSLMLSHSAFYLPSPLKQNSRLAVSCTPLPFPRPLYLSVYFYILIAFIEKSCQSSCCSFEGDVYSRSPYPLQLLSTFFSLFLMYSNFTMKSLGMFFCILILFGRSLNLWLVDFGRYWKMLALTSLNTALVPPSFSFLSQDPSTFIV